MIECLGDAEEALNGPQNKHLRIENKNFYFDVKRNQQGRYMSISEVGLYYDISSGDTCPSQRLVYIMISAGEIHVHLRGWFIL